MEKQDKSHGIKLVCPDCENETFKVYTRGKQGMEFECEACGSVYLVQ
jgi:ribosomal protein S27E